MTGGVVVRHKNIQLKLRSGTDHCLVQYYINEKRSQTMNEPILLVSLTTAWLSVYLYTRIYYSKDTFHRWYTIHNIHNGGAVLWAILCLTGHASERPVAICWSLSYFMIDLLDCCLRQDAVYAAHALFCLVLGVANRNLLVCQALQTNSKAALLELSNPFMHLAKKTRQPWHFALFALVFTLCRMVWLPVVFYQVAVHPPLDDLWIRRIVLTALALFYGLNCMWYYKIVRILVTGGKSEKQKER